MMPVDEQHAPERDGKYVLRGGAFQKSLSKNEQKILRYSTDRRSDDSSIGQNEDASRAQVSFHSRDFDLPRRRARIRGHDGADLQYPVLPELGGSA